MNELPFLQLSQLQFYLLGLISSLSPHQNALEHTDKVKLIYSQLIQNSSRYPQLSQLLKILNQSTSKYLSSFYPEFQQKDITSLSKNQLSEIIQQRIVSILKEEHQMDEQPLQEQAKVNEQIKPKSDVEMESQLEEQEIQKQSQLEGLHKLQQSDLPHNLSSSNYKTYEEEKSFFKTQQKNNQCSSPFIKEQESYIENRDFESYSRQEEQVNHLSSQNFQLSLSNMILPTCFAKMKEQVVWENDAVQDTSRFGHFLYGDQPLKILQIFIVYDELYVTVSWHQRTPESYDQKSEIQHQRKESQDQRSLRKYPKPSHLKVEEVIQYDPQLLIKFQQKIWDNNKARINQILHSQRQAVKKQEEKKLRSSKKCKRIKKELKNERMYVS